MLTICANTENANSTKERELEKCKHLTIIIIFLLFTMKSLIFRGIIAIVWVQLAVLINTESQNE